MVRRPSSPRGTGSTSPGSTETLVRPGTPWRVNPFSLIAGNAAYPHNAQASGQWNGLVPTPPYRTKRYGRTGLTMLGPAVTPIECSRPNPVHRAPGRVVSGLGRNYIWAPDGPADGPDPTTLSSDRSRPRNSILGPSPSPIDESVSGSHIETGKTGSSRVQTDALTPVSNVTTTRNARSSAMRDPACLKLGSHR